MKNCFQLSRGKQKGVLQPGEDFPHHFGILGRVYKTFRKLKFDAFGPDQL
jgi:hypothetical protein